MLFRHLSIFLLLLNVHSILSQSAKCRVSKVVSDQLERVIGQCQDELKLSILQDIIRQGLEATRIKREVEIPDSNEKTIAGCLLQCAYRKVKAVDRSGWPTQEGLIRLYAGGQTEGPYFVATRQAVQSCLSAAVKQRIFSGLESAEHNCDFAYDMFECISTQIDKDGEVFWNEKRDLYLGSKRHLEFSN